MTNDTTGMAAGAVPSPGAAEHPYTQAQHDRAGPMTVAETRPADRSAARGAESLSRADRMLVAMFAAMVTMFAALITGGVLAYTSLSGQLLGVQEQIGGLRTEVHQEIGGLRTEVHQEIGGLRTEMHREIGGLRTEMRREIRGLRTEVQEELGKVNDRLARIETFLQIHHGPLPGP